MHVASQILIGSLYKGKTPTSEYVTASIGTKLTSLSHDSDEYAVLLQYAQTTHTFHPKNEIIDIFAIDSNCPFSTKAKLLWHGTRAENIVGILSDGFKVAPLTST